MSRSRDRTRDDARPRRARVLVAAVVAGAALLAAVGFALLRPRAPDVPVPPPGTIDDSILAESVDSAVAAVRKAPDDADAWAALAMTYDANDFPVPAAACYRRAVELKPGVAAWWYDLAVVLEREDRFDEADTALFHAADIDPTYPPLHYNAALWALARGRLDHAESAARRTMETSHGATGAYIALGRVLLERGRDEEAAKTLERAVATWPKGWGEPAYARFLYGTALARLGRNEEAAPLLANGAVPPPILPDPWRDPVAARQDGLRARTLRAAALINSNRLTEAIAMYEDLRRRRPDNVSVACDLGSAYLLASRRQEATALLRAAAGEHPDSPEVIVRLVQALWEDGKRDEAMREADAAVARMPGSVVVLESRGGLLLDAERADAALADFEAAARLAPADASARASAGVAHLRLGHGDLARTAFEESLRRDAFQPDAVAGMALLALSRGDVQGADSWLKKIEDVPPQAGRLLAEARAARAKIP